MNLFHILNFMAVDVVGAIVTAVVYTVADWISEQIEGIRSLEWHPRGNFTLTVHGLFKVAALIIIIAFTARSAWKLIRRILR